MTAQDDFVKDQLDILQQMQIDGMDYEDYLRWQSKINDVKNGYDEARAVERDEKRSTEERRRAARPGCGRQWSTSGSRSRCLRGSRPSGRRAIRNKTARRSSLDQVRGIKVLLNPLDRVSGTHRVERRGTAVRLPPFRYDILYHSVWEE
jgi:hypothetical protein